MRVFVTGATGFIGTAIVQQLIGAGHQVLGLARSEANAQALTAAGAQPHRGDLQDLESLRSAAAACDGVIHAGFIHDFANFKQSCELDRRVIETFGEAIEGSGKPLIITSGIGLLPPGRLTTENDRPATPNPIPRVATEEAARALADRGLSVSIIRLPPSVHGEGDHGFVPILIGMAREKGVSAFIGEGNNLWPAVHRFDAASLYRLALEKSAQGACYHGVAEQGIPFRHIAEVIGRRLGVPTQSLSPEDAQNHFTWFTHFAAIDAPSSSQQTQQQLGWHPTHPGLLADIDQPYYFQQ